MDHWNGSHSRNRWVWCLLAGGLLLGGTARAAIRDGLIAHWRFDETTGLVAADATTNALSGTLVGFTSGQWVPGRVGGALRFRGPGSADFVRVPNYPKPTSAVSVAVWVQAEGRPTWASIIKNWSASAGQFHFGLQDSAGDLSIYTAISGTGTTSTRENLPLPLTSWQHVAFTFDGSFLRLYRNGVQVSQVAATGTLVSPAVPALGIGAKLNDSGTGADTGAPGFWQGSMDDLGLWRRALSPAEIAALYTAGLDGRGIDAADTPLAGSGGVSITEFMADNSGYLRDEDDDSPDWIEIYNGTAAAVNLAGWSLTDTANNLRKWVFPATNHAAGSYLIVFASNKDRGLAGRPLHTNFRLADGGEYLALVDPATNIVSEFRPTYPAQLPNVSFGIARQPLPRTFIDSNAVLRYFVPRDNTLGTNWVEPGFSDAAWLGGTNGVGYETAPADYVGRIRTDVRGPMFNLSPSCYLRVPFVVTNPVAWTGWRLRMTIDDGFVAWLNGEEIIRYAVPATATWDSVATTNRADATVLLGDDYNLAEFASRLVPGTNWLAIHALNAGSSSSDFLVTATLDARSVVSLPAEQRYFTAPTPGAANIGGVTALGPVLRSLAHEPAQPRDADDLRVTVQVQPAFGTVTNVTLRYRVMFGAETAVPMVDDGAHGDGLAGDGVFGAVIPATVSAPGQLVRYYVTTSDATGATTREPRFLDPLNSPQYQGVMVANLSVTSNLPVIHWYVADVAAAETGTGTRCSIVYGGNYYDNLFVRIRGGTARSWPKKSYKVEFNDGFDFEPAPGWPAVTEFDLNATYTDKSYNRAVVTAEMGEAAGLPSPGTFHVQMRQNGSFYSVALFVEQVDRDFLNRHGLDGNGALYKCNPGSYYEDTAAYEKKTRVAEGDADARALVAGLKLTGAALDRFVFDNVDVPAMVNFLAIIAVSQNIDGSDKNHFLYRDTEGSREWRMLPWDLDLTFGPDALNTDTIVFSGQDTSSPYCPSHPFIGARPYLLHGGKYNRFIEAIVNTPRTREMLLRRIRTLNDEWIGTGRLTARFNELVPYLQADVNADRARWGGNAHFCCNNYTLTQANSRITTEYLTPRRPFLNGTNLAGIGRANPFAQPLLVPLQLGEFEVSPASGNQNQEFLALTNPNPYAIDLAGWRVRGDIEHDFSAGTVMSSNGVIYLSPSVVEFRARPAGPGGNAGLFVQGNYRGHLSAGGGRVQLYDQWNRVVTTLDLPVAPSPAQQFLRVTELMYHPAPAPGGGDADAFEFVELQNLSPAQAIDLNGVRFTDGLTFDFSRGTITNLAPGGAVLLVRSNDAFTARYGPGRPVAGEFAGGLNNGGDRFRLIDARGEVIQEFSIRDDWYPATDGLGFSLVIVDPSGELARWSEAAGWRPGSVPHGSPGVPDPAGSPVVPVRITEVRATSPVGADWIELFNPGPGPAALGGWWLSDDFDVPNKFAIAGGTMLPAGSHLVIPAAAFAAHFNLDADGDDIWLFATDGAGTPTGYLDGFRFGAADDDVTFGPHMNSAGATEAVDRLTATPGASNAVPRVGPILISEINYRPVESATNSFPDREFVELHNPGNTGVPLWDATTPTNTWRLRGAVDFDFPTNVTLGAGGRAVVVNFDPADAAAAAEFRRVFGLSVLVPLYGPWAGQLANEGERIELRRPKAGELGRNPYVLVEAVDYSPAGSWPAAADGGGASLQRNAGLAYGNDPLVWIAAAPTPGDAPSVGAPPVITQSPMATEVTAFQSTNLSVTASGSGVLRYQWLQNGAALAGATNATLVLSNVLPDRAGSYQALVMNAAGTALSVPAEVTVVVPPMILGSPGSRTVSAGSSVTLVVVAVGDGVLRYQWFRDGVSVADATNSVLVFPAIRMADAGSYSVQVTDLRASVLSAPAVITVLEGPVIVSGPTPAFQDVLQGGTLLLNVTASGTPPLKFRWRRNNITVVNQTNTVLRITNMVTGNAGSYSVIVTNLAGAATSSVALAFFQPDFDRDGVGDNWERLYRLNTNSAADALLDSDGDGVNNRDEYRAGTSPTNAASHLRIASVLAVNSNQVQLGFTVASNRTVQVESLGAFGAPWQWSSGVPARGTNRTEFLLIPRTASNQWFRLTVPASP